MNLSRRGLLSSVAACALASLGLRLPGGVLLAGCGDEASKAQDRSNVLNAVVDAVALPSLQASNDAASALAASLGALASQPSAATLDAARAAWGAARKAHLRTLAFGLGPGDDISITSGILDEPCDQAKLDALAASSPDLTKVRSSAASARGFFAVEAMLYAGDASPEAALASLADLDKGPGRAALLGALGQDLLDKIGAVNAAWKGSFGAEIKGAGGSSVVFRSQLEAFDALLNQTLLAADRVLRTARKSAGVADVQAPVADRSGLTLVELDTILDGIENLYTSRHDGAEGPSIASMVAEQNAPLDASMRGKVSAARAALGGFTAPLAGAYASRKADVEGLIAQLRGPHDLLQAEVFPALGVTVNISEDDGD